MIKLADSSPAISVDELDKIEALLGVALLNKSNFC